MRFALSLVIIALLWVAPSFAQTEVDSEIVFLVDASNSIDSAENLFQRQGYADAIVHPDVLNAIAGGPLGRIAVALMEWADADSQNMVVGWTIVDGPRSAKNFSEKLVNAPRLTFGSNAIGEAIRAAHRAIEGNDIRGLRRIIDFSGDSANNWSGMPIEQARAAALAAGLTINGLAILCLEDDCGGRPVGYDLEGAFKSRIIGGAGSFVITVDSRDRFALAVRRKMILELSGTQEPQRQIFVQSGYPTPGK